MYPYLTPQVDNEDQNWFVILVCGECALTAGQADASVAIADRLSVVGNSVLRWFLYTDSIAKIVTNMV